MHIVYVKKPRPERLVVLTAALAGVISILLPVQSATAGEGLAEVLSAPRADDTLAAAGIRGRDLASLVAQISSTAFDTPASWSSELRARYIRADGEHFLVIRGTHLLCGGTGACQTWLFQRRASRWLSVIAGDPPVADWLGLGRRSQRGRRDLIAVAGLCLHVYVFDGRLYRSQSIGREVCPRD